MGGQEVGHERSGRRRGTILLASWCALAVVVAACGSPDQETATVQVGEEEDGREEVPETAPPDQTADALSSAARLSYNVQTAGTGRTTAAGLGVTVGVTYFEPIQLDTWTAPDECAVTTRVDVTVENVGALGPTLFEGPEATADRGTSGMLGTVLPMTIGDPARPSLVALVVAFGHDSVVTLTSTSADTEGGAAALDSQPLDGWTPLSIVLPDTEEAEDYELVVSLESQNGDTANETITVSHNETADALDVLNPNWVFDTQSVGEQCQPPIDTGDPTNQPRLAETDPFGVSISEPPPLPDPGEQPDDVPAATAAVLGSIRTVYDLGDVYAEDKAGYVEIPELARQILDEARQNRVVEPFLSALDPEFDSVAFQSPTEAAVLYRVGPGYHWSIGRVLLIDGTWRVALGTLCRDLAPAMYACPNVTRDPPPGPLG